MARKPNYRYERAERERLKAERQAIRDQRKASRGADAPAAEPSARDPAGLPGDDDPGRRDG